MKNHPDKNPGDEAASARFQAISEAYSILMDTDKRRFYDETGETDDAEVSPEEFREQFQDMMAELMGADSLEDMFEGMSTADIRAMPPFPFPKELFPPGVRVHTGTQDGRAGRGAEHTSARHAHSPPVSPSHCMRARAHASRAPADVPSGNALLL